MQRTVTVWRFETAGLLHYYRYKYSDGFHCLITATSAAAATYGRRRPVAKSNFEAVLVQTGD